MTYSHSRGQEGFTIIEIMVALVIVGLIGGLGIPAFMNYLASAKKQTASAMLKQLKGAITIYHLDTGKYPDKLRDLISKPSDTKLAKKWNGPYLQTQEVPDDPWGERYQYKLTSGGKHQYELYSFGPDGRGAPQEEWYSVWDD